MTRPAAPREMVINALRSGMDVQSASAAYGWFLEDMEKLLAAAFPEGPVAAVNIARSPHRLLTIPLADALMELSRWLEACEDYDPRRSPTLPPVAPFSLGEAWVVARLAAQDLAAHQGWNYDLEAAGSDGYVQVAYLDEAGQACVSDAALPLANWSKVYAWRAMPAAPPVLAEGRR